jgi:poly-gamma-glutamate capsule biosynthesis protein CapA/YwtB (metallophosphatase superfamily)
MAFTNNHSVDAGREGLLDTINLLKGQGIGVVGAGANLAAQSGPR